MSRFLGVALVLSVVWIGTALYGQYPGEYGDTDPPCLIDERVSLWLSLEAADRTIAALETERRELALELAQVVERLELLDREASGQLDERSLVEMTAALEAATEGEGKMDEAYVQIETRLVEIDRTLKRRRAQQAVIEDQIDQLLDGDR
jgi:hypothetical protein